MEETTVKGIRFAAINWWHSSNTSMIETAIPAEVQHEKNNVQI